MIQINRMSLHAPAVALAITVALAACSRPPATATPPPAREETVTRDEAARVAQAAKELRTALPVAPATPAAYGIALPAQYAAPPAPWGEGSAERYTHREPNALQLVADNPFSTFGADVDTASWSNVRRVLGEGRLPEPDAVRTEELLNYFDYGYAPPAGDDAPFAIHTETGVAPWNTDRVLLRIGIKAREVPRGQLPPANLVFLLDVSGSMEDPAKLPLLKSALRLLSRQMRAQDRVSIVVYAGAAGLVLEPTPGNDRAAIEAAIDRLQAGGSTNGGDGIRLAYDTARRAFVAGGINRVVLATDGDFNVGTTDLAALKQLVEARRAEGVSLSTLGFGYGNLNDALLNELAEIGNGNAAYIDSALEARKVLVDQFGGTLMTVAGDVKIQVEFSPRVREYRLVGYESRALRREDFNDDAKDAGEIGAGHSVTALYELTLAQALRPAVDPPRYRRETAAAEDSVALARELAFVKLRYKAPGEQASRLVTQPVSAEVPRRNSEAFRFAAAVAAFGQKLAHGPVAANWGYADIVALADGSRGFDPGGYRAEFVRLAGLAQSLAEPAPAVSRAE